MRAVVVAAIALLTLAPLAAGKGRPATVGWTDGARWGPAHEIDESTYAEDLGGAEMPRVVVRLTTAGWNRTAVLEFWDDLGEEWVVDDVQRSRRGTAILDLNPWCEDQDGNEVWCDGAWRYRIRLMPEGALGEVRLRGALVVYTPHEPCYEWDAWLCEEWS